MVGVYENIGNVLLNETAEHKHVIQACQASSALSSETSRVKLDLESTWRDLVYLAKYGQIDVCMIVDLMTCFWNLKEKSHKIVCLYSFKLSK